MCLFDCGHQENVVRQIKSWYEYDEVDHTMWMRLQLPITEAGHSSMSEYKDRVVTDMEASEWPRLRRQTRITPYEKLKESNDEQETKPKIWGISEP